MSAEPIITIQDVVKNFAGLPAVDQVSLAIGRGEFFSLLGPSGCGKTTLLRMIAGFEFPDAGDITIDGQPMAAVPANLRPTNMVFQSYAIFPHLNVRDNIAYGLRKSGLSREVISAKVDGWLDRMKLSGFGDRQAHQMSGGQRQRVALARALIKEPKVLLLDEPLGALDKKLREEMQLELRQIQRQVGITFVFVTHDQEEALALSDRIAVMGRGKVLQVADPKTLYERPASRDVAGFIGTINFMVAKVTAVTSSGATLATEGLGEVLIGADQLPAGPLAPGMAVSLAIRPEKITLGPPGGAGVAGVIAASSYLGDRSHYFIQVAGRETPVAVASAHQNAPGAADVTPGKAVTLSWAPESLLLLAQD